MTTCQQVCCPVILFSRAVFWLCGLHFVEFCVMVNLFSCCLYHFVEFCVMVNLFSCCLYHFVVARRQKLLYFGPIFHRCFLYWAFLLSLAQWAIPTTARRARLWKTYHRQRQCRTLHRSILSNRSILWNPWSRRVMIRILPLSLHHDIHMDLRSFFLFQTDYSNTSWLDHSSNPIDLDACSESLSSALRTGVDYPLRRR